jgi:hypothetical protein
MQVKFGEFNVMQNEDIQQINPDEIAGYVIQRSPASNFLFDVFAVNHEGELLVCVESDLSLEEAQQKVDAVNKEYFPVVPTETELVTIQLENEQRIFSAAK